MVTTISDKKLKGLIKESVREVFKTEVARLRALIVPDISAREQKDIEKHYGTPKRKKAKSYSLRV